MLKFICKLVIAYAYCHGVIWAWCRYSFFRNWRSLWGALKAVDVVIPVIMRHPLFSSILNKQKTTVDL